MGRKRLAMMSEIGRNLHAGTAELSSQFARLTVAALRLMASGVVALFLQLPWRLIPSPLAIFRAGGSAVLWAIIGILVINIRFAANVLPQTQVDLWSINRPASLTVLDRDGEIIGIRGSRYGDPVSLEDLPPHVIDAFISTEDRRFFEHRGFDLRGLTRAVIANIRAGTVVQGGSTITQQLAKNLFLSPDRTLMRKFEEIQLAFWLEARLSKEEILSLYLNRTYLGAGSYGIEAASTLYFGKPAVELTLPEAALLAGLPKAPSALAPTVNLEGALERGREVIDNMVETGRIDEVTASIAKLTPPALQVTEQYASYGYFLDHVVAELEKRFGALDQDLVVTTTLDQRIQRFADAAVDDVLSAETAVQGAEQASLIAFDEKGGIVAMVGGLDYQYSQFNRATQAKRQPGSAFKPFVFLAALEAGFSPESVLIDQPVKVEDWAPRNYTGRHRGPMRLNAAFAASTNSVAVQLSEAIGRDRVVDAARRSGISQNISAHASLPLGTEEMALIDLTAAYMPFAHAGAEVPPHSIREVRTRQGETLYQFEPIEGFRVIEAAHAKVMTQMLEGVVNRGTGRRARLSNQPVAGKTGTTNEWRDAWFIGFSPYYTAGVWVGNDRAEPMREISGSTLPLQIWHDFMAPLHEDLPRARLATPEVATVADVTTLSAHYDGLRSDLINVIFPPQEPSWWGRSERGFGRRVFGRSAVPDRADEDRLPPPQQGNDGGRRVVGRAAPGLGESTDP